MRNKRFYLLPKTTLGKVSLILITAFFLSLIIGMLVVSLGQTGGDTIFDNLLISIPMFLAGACSIASFITGIISIIKKKERSILVFISTFIGLIVLWFLIGEILVSH